MRHSIKISPKSKAFQSHNIDGIDGYVLTWNTNAGAWVPGPITIKNPIHYNFSDGYVSVSGDLSGTYSPPTVIKINGK